MTTLWRRGFNGLFKTELIGPQGPWRGLDDLEIAVLAYVDWFNHRRLHGELGMITPAEAKAIYYRDHARQQHAERGTSQPPLNPGRFRVRSPESTSCCAVKRAG